MDDAAAVNPVYERDDPHGEDASPSPSPLGNRSPNHLGGGRLDFRKALDRDIECSRLRAAGWVTVELEGIGPSARGRLAEVLDAEIERELASRGATSAMCPGLASAPDRYASLGDQLFRARRLGAPGIAVVLGPLRAAAGWLGALEPEDCATLRFLAGATRDCRLVVLLDERDATTGAYGDPQPLADLLSTPDGVSTPAQPFPTAGLQFAHTGAPASVSLLTEEAPALIDEVAPRMREEDPIGLGPPPLLAAPSALPPVAPTPTSSTVADGVEGQDRWRTWTLQLVAARGPQPLGVLEKIFTDSYMPLANAVAAGLEDVRARGAADEFRTAFARSYAEAFPTFSATTKRPRMVLDVHDCASRIARLHGARSTRMLLVDAMRWDMARQIQQRLGARLGERAVLTDELLLWSALPTTTMRQLETIARGVDALRSPGEMDADAEPPRGRTAEYVRRLRVGAREVHKLDVVESRLQGARGGVLRAMPEIADAAAEAIARHVDTLAPKTLLFVFGDHGFTVDKTGTARQGGASPEEVLVGAFGLLVGDVH